jgi:hypothetical protein
LYGRVNPLAEQGVLEETDEGARTELADELIEEEEDSPQDGPAEERMHRPPTQPLAP